MVDFRLVAMSAHKLNDTVIIATPAMRTFSLPGDDDPSSNAHGHLVVRSIEYAPPGEYDSFMYTLAVNKQTPEVFIVPERAVEVIQDR